MRRTKWFPFIVGGTAGYDGHHPLNGDAREDPCLHDGWLLFFIIFSSTVPNIKYL